MRRISTLFLSLLTAAALATCALAYAPDEIVGEVAELLQGMNEPGALISGTPLGAAAADAVRDAAGADLAIVNGADLAQNLQGGEATWADLQAVFAADRPVGLTTVTPAGLKEILEIAVSNMVCGEDDCLIVEQSKHEGFVQPSGFSYEVDGSAAPGERVLEIKLLSTGEKLDLTDTATEFTLAASEYMLSGGYGMPALPFEPLGFTLTEALAQAVAGGTLTAPGKERVSIVGTADDRLIDIFPIGVIVLAAVLIGLFNYKKNTRYDYTRYNYRNEEGYERKEYIKN